MPRKYNAYAVPRGTVNVNRRSLADTTATREQRKTARVNSSVSTGALRAKLTTVSIVQDGDGWAHAMGDKILARFANVGDAVAAL